MKPLLDHVRNHLIGYLALFVALGGTSYAATSLPTGSVGAPQLNRNSIGGYVRAWAHVRHDGRVLSGSPGARAIFTGGSSSLNFYFVRWRGVKLPARCAPLVTLSQNGGTGATTVRASINRAPAEVGVVPTQVSGNSAPADFYVAVIC